MSGRNWRLATSLIRSSQLLAGVARRAQAAHLHALDEALVQVKRLAEVDAEEMFFTIIPD